MRILVLVTGGIGDILVTVPVIACIQKKYPHSEITLAAPERMRQILKHLCYCYVDVNGRMFTALHSSDTTCSTALEEFFSEFDLVVSFLGKESPVTSALRRMTKMIVAVDSKPPVGYRTHVSQFLWNQVSEHIAIPTIQTPNITVDTECHDQAQKWALANGLVDTRSWTAIHPGSGSRLKNWGAENFAKLVGWLADRYPRAHVILVEGEADAKEVKRVHELINIPTTVAKHLPLGQLAAVLSRCMIFFGNDSGITHLSAAIGVPTVAIFKTTNEKTWRPWAGQ